MQANLQWRKTDESRERAWTGERGTTNGQRKLLRLMDKFVFLIVVMVLWMYVYVKLIQLYTLNICSLLYVNCTPTKQFKYSICLWLVYAVLCLISQSFLTLCDSMDCSPPGFSVPGIFQARILAWVAISSPRGSSWPRNQTRISHLLYCRKILYSLSY